MVESKLEVNILKPFGPRILHASMPKEFVETLNSECDEILTDEEKRKELDESAELVGHVAEELKCDLNKPQFRKYGGFLCDLVKFLHVSFLEEKDVRAKNEIPDRLIVHNSWFVRSFEYDYNPTHIHTSGAYSCVAYLKVPEGISEKNSRNTKEKYATEGYIDFIYGTSSVVNAGNLCCKPAVGDIYIFPAHLYHTVYPFFGEGERRSFSANLSLTMDEKK
jgi:hypothetical protein|tara:strand:+ start:297 stop:959 length:663 start_codon:yes stop_codon:yes gene_type:complete